MFLFLLQIHPHIHNLLYPSKQQTNKIKNNKWNISLWKINQELKLVILKSKGYKHFREKDDKVVSQGPNDH